MSTTVKQNGTAKKVAPVKQNGATVRLVNSNKAVSKELAEKALGKEVVKTLDERISNFEKLRGLANQREKLLMTLNELTKFKYNNGDSCVFLIRDEDGKEFKTTNNNLIKLVTDTLQNKLFTRKAEIENDILHFDF